MIVMIMWNFTDSQTLPNNNTQAGLPQQSACSLQKQKWHQLNLCSLPRLELCVAVLLTNLTLHLRQSLGLISAPAFLWSYSRIMLHWIQGHASKWKIYVANRVSHIQVQFPNARWRHVSRRDNPADCVSRGSSHGICWTIPYDRLDPPASTRTHYSGRRMIPPWPMVRL